MLCGLVADDGSAAFSEKKAEVDVVVVTIGDGDAKCAIAIRHRVVDDCLRSAKLNQLGKDIASVILALFGINDTRGELLTKTPRDFARLKFGCARAWFKSMRHVPAERPVHRAAVNDVDFRTGAARGSGATDC